MTTNLAELKQAAPAKKPNTFPAMLTAFAGEIARALPKHLNGDRLARICLTEFRKNPKLGNCDPRSVFAAVIQASQLGLEPGVRGRAYLVPYGNECQFIPGWMGLVDLVNRTGRATAWTGAVFEGDEFDYALGDSPYVKHKPGNEYDPAKITHVYAVGRVNGSDHPIIEVWPITKVLRHRDRYNKVGKAHYSYTNWEMYARKVPLLQVLKYLPASVELESAITAIYAAEAGRQDITVKDAIEGTWVPVIADGEADAQEPAARPSEGTNATGPADKPTQVPAGEGPTEADVLAMLDRAKNTDDLDTAMSLSEPGNKAVLKRYNERKSALTKGARNVE